MVNRLIATGLLAIVSLWLVACGTGSVGSTGIPSKDESHSGAGVWAGSYEVIRYNEAGFPDPALNSTLQVALNEKGGQTALVISVKDSVHTDTVALDVHYPGGAVHPEDVKFFGALGDESQVLSASFLTQVPGTAAIGQTGINDYKPARIDGTFAQLTFAPGGLRSVSAAGDVHQAADGVGYHVGAAATNPIGDTTPEGYLSNIIVDDDQAAHPGSLDLAWYAAWHLGDGNQNGQVEIADLSPLGKYLNQNVGDNFAALPADYDGNGIVAASDLSKMGKHLLEGTDNYLVEVNDNDGSENNLTTVGTYDWSQTAGDDWTAPTDPQNATAPTPESLDPVFKKWTVHFDDLSAVTMQQLSDIDQAGNGDQKVAFHVTPVRGTQEGVSTSIEATVNFAPPVRNITVNEVRIRVEGASGGDDDGTYFDDDTAAGSVVANSQVTVSIVGISGIYSSPAGGGNFNGVDPFPADMTQADYDDALALAQTTGATGFTHFTVANGGAAGFRYRSDWLTFQAPPPAFGDLGDGTVFPDDDPDSTGASSEGQLSLILDSATDQDGDPLRSITFTSYNKVFLFDVTADPNAPILADPINLMTGQPVTELTLLEGTQVSQDITMPATIQDPTGVTYQLLEILPTGAVGEQIDFTYDDGAQQQGEFFVKSITPPSLQAFVSGVAINPGSTYHFTFKDDQGGPWSSLNTPDALLTTAQPPPPQDLISVPNRLGPGDYDTLRIMLPEPKIRRDPRVIFNVIDETIDPVDAVGYNDVLKMSGQEILLGVGNFEQYPRVTLLKDATPDMIDATTVGDAGFIVTETAPDHMTVDCAVIFNDLQSGEQNWAYKLFNENDTAFGQGTFIAQALRFDDPAPFAVNWSVNTFDRLNTPTETTADLLGLYTNRTIKHSNVGTGTPDVLWFQFNGGYMFNESPAFNTKAVFEWWDGNGNDFSDSIARLDLRIAGIAPNGDYIALHVVTEDDYYTPGGLGNFIDGMSYIVHLDDPKYPTAWETTYGIGNPDGDEFMLFCSGG